MPKKTEKQSGAETGLRQFEPVSDDLLLAAVGRAERHDPRQHNRDRVGAPLSEIAEHLGFVATGWTSRKLRPQLDALVTGGVLDVTRRDRLFYWSSTDAGRNRLASLRRSRRAPVLPESPQHRAWRTARSAAAEHVDRLGAELRHSLVHANTLLGRHRRVGSDEWFILGRHLDRGCKLLGTAAHCLHEWQEPDDAKADVDLHESLGDEQLTESVRNRRRSLRGGRRHLLQRLREDQDAFGPLETPTAPELITVPANLVGDLRDGLLHELAMPAGEILDLVGLADREQRAQEYDTHLEHLEEARDLIDLVGWSTARQPTAITIDLHRHHRGVTAALDYAIQDAEFQLERSDLPRLKRDAITRQLPALCEFTAAVTELATRVKSQEDA